MNLQFEREYNPTFVGRDNELKWLDDHLLRERHSFSPLIVSGPVGIGKTALLRQWFSSRRISYTPIWLDLSSNVNSDALDNLILQIDKQREDYHGKRGLTIVIDGTDIWSLKQHEEVTGRIFNYKAVSSLVFIRQIPLELSRSEQLGLTPLSNSSIQDLLEETLSTDLTDDQIAKAILASKGHPLAVSILSRLIKGESIDSILSLVNKPLYDLSKKILIPEKEIIIATRPVIISANNGLISSLKKQPSDLRKLTPREFEQLLADLLSDMGWEVELTKQTRDGGSDILAYLNTDIGKLLCLVEAKHYREDRKIGVDLVRTLYGTLCDAQANSAMLVTSSSFSPDAKVFQQRHKYQLTLREYADVVEWILKFGQKKNDFA